MDPMTELKNASRRYPDEFAKAKSFDEFAHLLDASKPGHGRLFQYYVGKYPKDWDNAFATIKAHGYMFRPLLLPHASKASDLFAGVKLFCRQEGGVKRDDIAHLREGFAYVGGYRAPEFAYFGYLGAHYGFSPNGHKRISDCYHKGFMTCAKPSQAVIDVMGAVGTGEWALGSFEATHWPGRGYLITARCVNGFGERWLAFLPENETAFALLSEWERREIDAENARKAEAWGVEP